MCDIVIYRTQHWLYICESVNTERTEKQTKNGLAVHGDQSGLTVHE